MSKESYHDRTYNSKNPLRRLAHRSRFKKSVEHIDIVDGMKILDFGCGDGLFLNQLSQASSGKNYHSIGFEPYMEMLASNTIPIYKEWDEIVSFTEKAGKFDFITCFEVFEHFNPQRQEEAIQKFSKVLADNGKIIISVPIEKGFPAVVKNIVRRLGHPAGKHIYNFKNISKSFFGKPVHEFRNGDKYLNHMGFYFNDLEGIILNYFNIEKKEYSPFKLLGYHLNSQVFYTLRRKDSSKG